MKAYLNLILVGFLLGCNANTSTPLEKKHITRNAPGDKPKSVNEISTKDTLILTEINDSLLIENLFDDLHYEKGRGFVYEGDTVPVKILIQIVPGRSDTLCHFLARSREIYQNAQSLFYENEAYLLKRGKKWIVTDTTTNLISSAYDTDTITTLGDYFICTGISPDIESTASSKSIEVFYRGHRVGGIGCFGMNGGYQYACNPEEGDACYCELAEGEASIQLDQKTKVVLLEKKQTEIKENGYRCQNRSTTTTITKKACYKSYGKTIYETVIGEGKKEIKTKITLTAFLEEAKKALGEK